MSVAELKQAVDQLSADERLELAEYLRWRSRRDDPDWQAEIGKRLDRCVAGEGHPAAELIQLHDKLTAARRSHGLRKNRAAARLRERKIAPERQRCG